MAQPGEVKTPGVTITGLVSEGLLRPAATDLFWEAREVWKHSEPARMEGVGSGGVEHLPALGDSGLLHT